MNGDAGFAGVQVVAFDFVEAESGNTLFAPFFKSFQEPVFIEKPGLVQVEVQKWIVHLLQKVRVLLYNHRYEVIFSFCIPLNLESVACFVFPVNLLGGKNRDLEIAIYHHRVNGDVVGKVGQVDDFCRGFVETTLGYLTGLCGL